MAPMRRSKDELRLLTREHHFAPSPFLGILGTSGFSGFLGKSADGISGGIGHNHSQTYADCVRRMLGAGQRDPKTVAVPKRSPLLRHADSLDELSLALTTFLTRSAEFHRQLEEDDLSAEQFAPTVDALRRCRDALHTALAEEIGLAAHYTSWTAIGAAVPGETRSGLSSLYARRNNTLAEALSDLKGLSPEP